jgi:hypothetical protein
VHKQIGRSFLGKFAKVRKAAIIFVMSVRPSAAKNWRDFHEILYFGIFRKPVENIQVPSDSDKSNGYFT